MFRRVSVRALILIAVLAISAFRVSSSSLAEDGDSPLTIDHYVSVRSTVPSMAGQFAQIYVRERLRPGVVLRAASLSDRVVLFVHGAGTPAEVAFDVSYKDYSWMSYLAESGFDVFAMDMTGYGRSTQPTTMNDPCNLAADQQKQFIPDFIAAVCDPSYPHQATTLGSDWNDIGAVVEYIRALRHVDKINLIAWSLGGPRAGGYAAQHPERVSKMILLAPSYDRNALAGAPQQLPANGATMTTQSHEEFTANWDRQVGCPNQYDLPTSDSVWSEMMKSDLVGATWGAGVRRAPEVTRWGWNADAVARTEVPVLMISGQYDKQVQTPRVRDLYANLGSHQKVFVDLACSSHNAMWEMNHLLLFRASLEWLADGTVNGKQQGILRLGYPGDAQAQ